MTPSAPPGPPASRSAVGAIVWTLIGLPPALLLATALAGTARQAGSSTAQAIALGLLLALGPALAAGLHARADLRGRAVGATLALTGLIGLWSMATLAPGSREDAVVTGVGVILGDADPDGQVAVRVGASLPAEPAPLAEAVAAAPTPAAPPPVPQDAIVLPYEGEGRRLTVPVVFEHDGVVIETFMMLDTGATYTTLPTETLRRLGALPPDDAPRLTLTTANGPREAAVTLVDRVWLGDLMVPAVAATPCDDCAGDGAAGLLGLNVASGFNVTIDADRREVVFHRRARFDRHLDIRPFTELDAQFLRFPNDRVEVHLGVDNGSPWPIARAVTHVGCGDTTWRIVAGPIPAQDRVDVVRRLPDHARCPRYQIGIEEADWQIDVPAPAPPPDARTVP